MLEEQNRFLSLAVPVGEETRATENDVPEPFEPAGAAVEEWRGDLLAGKRPRAKASVRVSELGEDVVILDRERRRLLVLDPVAAAIWEFCDGHRTVEKITQEVAAALSRPGDGLRDDVVRTVIRLASARLVEF
jgi:hypothetical protein